jgi:HEAT repeat protein
MNTLFSRFRCLFARRKPDVSASNQTRPSGDVATDLIRQLSVAMEPSEVADLFEEMAATHNADYVPAMIAKIECTAADASFDHGWRNSMVKKLGKLGSRDAVDFLIAILEGQKGMRDALGGAICALGLLGDKRAEEPLLKAFSMCLPFKDAPIREFNGCYTSDFFRALRSLGSPAVTKVMIRNLEAILGREMPTGQQLDASTKVAEALTEFLGQTGDKDAVDILLRTLSVWFPGTVHNKAVWSLKKLGVTDPLRETILQIFSKMLSRSPWAGNQKKCDEELKSILWILDR